MRFRAANLIALILLGLLAVQGIHLPDLHEEGLAACSAQCQSCSAAAAGQPRLSGGCSCPPCCPGQAEPCTRLACHLCQLLGQFVAADGLAASTSDALLGTLAVDLASCRPTSGILTCRARGPPVSA